jgi:hypothetical protein
MTTYKTVVAEEWSEAFFRSNQPWINWNVYNDPRGVHARKIGDTLLVIFSGQRERDGRRWAHVSMSRPSRLPSWDDVREVKDTFIGRDRRAIQILPPQAEYVNLHKNVLHLWHCLDGDGLPDFRIDGQI